MISGYGSGKNAVEGTGGSFSFYDLGEPLMIDGDLNEKAGTEKIREYVWFMETRQTYTRPALADAPDAGGNRYLLGVHNDTAWFFYYEPSSVTTLNLDFLETIRNPAEHAVIYADRCAVGEKTLDALGITFKKIPRDIARL